MAIKLSRRVREKLLTKHGVVEDEVAQCFANKQGKYLKDTREDHASDPPTLWFISETDHGRKLKVAFVPKGEDNIIRTAFPPNEAELRIYDKYGK